MVLNLEFRILFVTLANQSAGRPFFKCWYVLASLRFHGTRVPITVST